MKRLKLALIILLVLSMTGCAKEYTATPAQTNAIAEYMAGLILDYDRGYKQALLPEEDLTEVGSNQVTEAPLADQANSQTDITSTSDSQKNITISDILGNKNFDITYQSYQISETYPKDSDSALFVIKHSNGYRLFVVKFNIKNVSDKAKTIKLTDKNIAFMLQLKDRSYSPLLTLLENDLQYIDMKINAGKSKESILIFEVPEDADTSNTLLNVSGDGNTASITIK